MRIYTILAICCSLISGFNPTHAQLCTPRVVYSLGGEFSDGHASGGLLALAQGRAGVLLVDITSPDQPVEISRTDPGHAARVAMSPGLLASVSDDGVVSIIDLTDPASPTIIGGLTTQATAPTDALFVGSILYVASPDSGVSIIDTADPHRPRSLGRIANTTPALGITHAEGTLLVATGDTGVQIFDITTPSAPRWLGEDPVPADGVALRNQVAFTSRNTELRAVDITDPGNPETLWNDETTYAYAAFIEVVGDRLYWFQYGWDLASYDITDPAIKVPLPIRQRWISPRALTHDNDTLITIGKTEAKLSTPSQPSQTTVLDHINARRSLLLVSGSRAFIETTNTSVSIIDLSDPENLSTLYEFETTAAQWTDGTYMLSSRNGLTIWDVREGQTPTRLGSHRINSHIWDFATIPGIAFLRSNDDDFYVIDWQDPTNPIRLDASAYPDGFRPYDITADGLLCGWNPNTYELLLLDVTTPTAPITVGVIPTLGLCFNAWIEGDLLFTSERIVRIIDIADPANPKPLSVLKELWGLPESTLKDNLLYMAGDPATIWDLVDPVHPVQIGFIPDLPGVSKLLPVGDAWAIIADNLDGGYYKSLITARFDPTTGPAMLGRIETISGAANAAARDGAAVIGATYPYGLWFIDLADPDRPVVVDRMLGLSGTALAMDDRYTYYMDIDNFCVLQGSTALDARIIGSVSIGRGVTSMVRKGDNLYLTRYSSAIIINVADPTDPQVLLTIPGNQTARGFDVDQDIACIAYRDSTFVFIDISDPDNLQELGSIKWGIEGGQVAFDDGWVIASIGTALLMIFDARDPADPQIASFLHGTAGPIRRFSVQGDTVHATAKGSLMTFDITDRLNPYMVAEIHDLADTTIPVVSNDRVFVAASSSPSFISIDLGCDTCPADLDADGDADAADLILYLNAWADQRNQPCQYKNCLADLDHNGTVDTRDFIIFLNAWAAGC